MEFTIFNLSSWEPNHYMIAMLILILAGKQTLRGVANFILRMRGKPILNGNGNGEHINRTEFEAHQKQDTSQMEKVFARLGDVETRVGALEVSTKQIGDGVNRIETILIKRGLGNE